MNALFFLAGCVCLGACNASSRTAEHRVLPPGAEAFSIQGQALYPAALPPEEQAKLESQLAEAKSAWDARPDDPLALIWYGRRLGYLSRFQEAIVVFSQGVARHPEDARMYRFRGHRYITVRDFGRARADLERAADLAANMPDEPEPAGKPNARGVVVDTLKQNIYYHLALAYYLQGDFEGAVPVWRECLRYSTNPDSLCSATYWLTMTLARAGREAEARPLLAAIRPDLDVIEYFGYHKLCLAYKGDLDPNQLFESTPPTGKTAVDFATIGYGIGTWNLTHGHSERAHEIYSQVAGGEVWAAFGHIAAEVELARFQRPSR